MEENRCRSNCTCSQLKKAKETIAELTMIFNNAAVKLSEVSQCVKQLKCETCHTKSSSSCTEEPGMSNAVEELNSFASPVEKMDSIASPVEEIDSIASAVNDIKLSSVEDVQLDSIVTAVEEIVLSLVEDAQQRSIASAGEEIELSIVEDAQHVFGSLDVREKNIEEDSFSKGWTRRILKEAEEEQKEL